MAAELVIAAILVLAATGLIIGLAARTLLYARTPVPLPVATNPAPTTQAGAALRVGREIVLFHSLWGADKPLWLAAMLFHLGLALVLLRHLRYVVEIPPMWLVALQPAGKLGALAMMAGLALLLLRRIAILRVRKISRPTDYGWLILLGLIGGSGLAMTYGWHTDIIGLKDFLAGLWRGELRPLPGDPALIVHMILAAALIALLPVSKLLHIPGVLFSPSRASPDSCRLRENRHG
jgi:nitrate reductase gamma subunit